MGDSREGVLVEIDDVYASFSDQTPDKLISELRKYFSFETSKHVKRNSPGYVPDFQSFVRPTGTFKTGLLKYVCERIENHYNLDIYVDDNRSIQGAPVDEDIQRRINDYLPYNLRPYQQDCLHQLLDHQYGIVDVATGGGKTVVMAASILAWWEKTLVLIHQQDLARQLQEELSELTGSNVGFIGAGIWNPEDITVGMVPTLSAVQCGESKKQRIQDYLKTIDYVVADECHHMKAKTWRKVARWCSNASIRHGFSATPITDTVTTEDGKKQRKNLYLYSSLGPTIYQKRIGSLIDEGYLADIEVNMVSNEAFWDESPMDYADEYKRVIVNTNNKKDCYDTNRIICEIMRAYWEHDAQVIGFVQRIAHGRQLSRRLQDEFDISRRDIAFVNGQNVESARREAIEDFKDGSLPIIFGTVLGEGLNFFCDAGINIERGKFKGKLTQKQGRIARKSATDPETGDVDTDVHEQVDWWDFSDTGHRIFEKHANNRARRYVEGDFHVNIVDPQDVRDVVESSVSE